MFNISTRKVGGLRFIKIGRLTFMFCLSRKVKPLKRGSKAMRDAVASVMNEVDNPFNADLKAAHQAR